MRLHLSHINIYVFGGHYNASWRPDESFTCMSIYHFYPLCRAALVWLSNRLLTSQATPFIDWRNGKFLQERVGKFFHTVMLQVSTYHLCGWGPCMGIPRAITLLAMPSKLQARKKVVWLKPDYWIAVAMALSFVGGELSFLEVSSVLVGLSGGVSNFSLFLRSNVCFGL